MKEYISTFEKSGVQTKLRKAFSDQKVSELKKYIGKRDVNGILLVSIEPIKGISYKDFLS